MHTRSAQLLIRQTALFTAIVCLWMSGVVSAMHTDDLQGLLPASGHGPMVLCHAMPIPPDGPCAACEWTQFGRTLNSPEVSVTYTSLCLIDRRDTLPVALHLRAFDHISDRAPPISS